MLLIPLGGSPPFPHGLIPSWKEDFYMLFPKIFTGGVRGLLFVQTWISSTQWCCKASLGINLSSVSWKVYDNDDDGQLAKFD